MRAERPHVLQLLFDGSWGVRQRIVNWDEVAWRESVAFFLDQASLGTREADWYRALLRRGAAREDFDDHWRRIEGKGRRALLVKQGRTSRQLEVRLYSAGSPAGENRFTIGYTQLASGPRLRVARYLRVRDQADNDRE